MREEMQVEIETLNNKPFRGKVLFYEAKHGIYKDCHGFNNL
jgi:hypothetical protein